MEIEKKVVDYVHSTTFSEIPKEAVKIVKNMVLDVIGTSTAGAGEGGVDALREFYVGLGGKKEATILIHGEKIPAHDAAFVNSVMARALDFENAMAPGFHPGASAIPTALAAAELAGGCDGKAFLTALALGVEIASRLNLSEAGYDGFDPTGVVGVFETAVIASRILNLTPEETWNALALAFNKAGASLQSNVDGSLAVRVIQGWVSQSGITCARLARAGISGPKNFLEGVYGYFHLYAKDTLAPKTVAADFGKRFDLQNVVFKKYPCCGMTQGPTHLILDMIHEHNLTAESIDRIDVMVPPYCHKLVGHPFRVGDNPRVSGQFSIQYCIANALMRGRAKLQHFEESNVKDPKIMALVQKVHVIADPALNQRGHTALDMKISMKGGVVHRGSVDIAIGFPGNPLSQEEHEERFWDCMRYASRSLPGKRAEQILSMISNIEQVEDVRALVNLLLI
jgi:2-methylcitrate dehydratase PrpD